MFATGYNYDFSFLPRNVLQMSGHRVALYKHVFPPALEHNTLAVVGFIHALGAIMPQAEMQARWVARVFKGSLRLDVGLADWLACWLALLTCWLAGVAFPLSCSICFCSTGLKKLPSSQAMLKSVDSDTKDMDKK